KRFYLLAGVAAAWIFPFITFRKLPLAVDLTPTVFIDLDTPAVSTSFLETTESSAGVSINWLQILLLVYLAGLSFMFLKNLIIVFKWNLTWRHTRNEEGVAFIKKDQVFTLFTRIFIPGSLKGEQDLDNVLLHEQAHIRQLHYIDLMLIELTLLLTWFNPFSWLISRMIKENHEHLADREVLSAGVNPARYRAQLMNHTLGVNVFRLGNQFNHSLTLKRFKMMKKPRKSPLGIIKIALLIPAVLVTLGLTTGMTPQQKTVTGKVIFADTGEPATGASVVVRNGTLGSVVDTEGTFILNVDGDPELVISFVGYESLIVKASDIGKKPLKLEVKTYTMDLESVPLEVKQEVSGSISIKLKEGEEANPVFVLDGKKVVEGIDDLDPNEIESISVIKDPDDPLVKKYNAKDGVILITTKDAAIEEEEFFVVEDMPQFNGGEPATEFRKYIAENLRYPETAAKNEISGRVIVQFTVDKTGKVVDPVVVRGVDPALDKEALRVVNSSPKWTPGMQRGKKVDVVFTYPFNFVLDDPKKDGTEKTETITLKKTDGSEANPVYILDGKQIDNIENINPDLIDNISVYKNPDSPMVKKYNAKDGVVVITTKEAAAKENEMESFEKDGEVFYIVEDMPKFPGGTPALKTYIYSNLEYPEKVKNEGIEGEVVVRFLVNEKGQVVNEEVLRSTYEGFDAPALKVISEMPDWTPGKQRGKAVKVWYVVSIKFDDNK
ncbi:MAG: TonB family protein, partial [Bacteroidota bacterium]|nr:TonB family protein [Bacteroidota bacterium]